MTIAYGGVTSVATTPAGAQGGVNNLTTYTVQATGVHICHASYNEYLATGDAHDYLGTAFAQLGTQPIASKFLRQAAWGQRPRIAVNNLIALTPTSPALCFTVTRNTTGPTLVTTPAGTTAHWDTVGVVDETVALMVPQIQDQAGALTSLDEWYNPIVFDCGSDLAGIPSWAAARKLRFPWCSSFDVGTDVPPTDSRAVPHHANCPYGSFKQGVGPLHRYMRMSTDVLITSGYIDTLTGAVLKGQTYHGSATDGRAMAWWAPGSATVAWYGRNSYITSPAAPTLTLTLTSSAFGGINAVLQSWTLTPTLAYNDTTNKVACWSYTATTTATASALPSSTYYTWSLAVVGATSNYSLVTVPYCPVHFDGLVQCPATGVSPAMPGYLLGIS